MGPVARLADRALRGYQRVTAGRPSPCRYTPTCSQYAREALASRGLLVATWLTIGRLLRCHPWGGHGHDPVPAPPRKIDAHV